MPARRRRCSITDDELPIVNRQSRCDKEVICFQYDTIGRDQTARGEHYHIAWHYLFGGQHLRLATTQQAGFDRDL